MPSRPWKPFSTSGWLRHPASSKAGALYAAYHEAVPNPLPMPSVGEFIAKRGIQKRRKAEGVHYLNVRLVAP